MNIILNGVNGAMGQTILKVIQQQYPKVKIAAGVDLRPESKYAFPQHADIFDVTEKADAIVDFSRPEAVSGLLQYATGRQIPILIATTGLSDAQKEEINQASKKVAVFYSANMSLGVNLQKELIAKAASVLYPEFEVEIIEKHHDKKADAPSGTALVLADALNSAVGNQLSYTFGRHGTDSRREKNELGIHAVRGGTVVGEHSVLFLGQDEVIEVTHRAMSKSVFAVGAIKAALFLKGKAPGLYNMQDLFAENL